MGRESLLLGEGEEKKVGKEGGSQFAARFLLFHFQMLAAVHNV